MTWFADYPISQHPISYLILFLIFLLIFVGIFFSERPLVGVLLGMVIALLVLCCCFDIGHWLGMLLDQFLGLAIWSINFLFYLIGNFKSNEGMLVLLAVVILALIKSRL